MKPHEQLLDFLVGRVAFPVTNYLLNRKNILSKYYQMLETERIPEASIRALQLKRLINTISYANQWIPYYQKKFRSIGLVPEDIKTLEDINLIPPTSRQDVIDNRMEMVDIRYRTSIRVADKAKRGPGVPIPMARFRRYKLVRNTSSGSTGAPTVFYEDGSTTALNWAHELRLKSWYGLNPGIREARLIRMATEFMTNGRDFSLRKYLWHQLILSGLNLSDDDYALCLQKINAYRPRILWGFTSALTGLAEFIDNHRDRVQSPSLELIITWAAPLYDHEKKCLKKVFNCPVTNIYGSREVGHVASLCPHDSLHINQEHLLVESIKEDSLTQAGEIAVTTLYESPMPFIRYRMGDLGIISPSDCPCGLTLQVLKEFLGRTGEIFVTRDGRMISPNFWCRTFMDEKRSRAIKRFQVIYRKNGDICLRIVRSDNYSTEIEADLGRFLEKNFHASIKFEFEYVPEIKPQVSGKYQMVVNEAL